MSVMKPGREQQHAAEDHQHAVDDLAVRDPPGGERLVEAPPRGAALRAQQRTSRARRRRSAAAIVHHTPISLADLDQQRQLGDRDDDEEEDEEQGHGGPLNATTPR